MARIEKAIEVDVPVRVAYNQWTQFEEFPRFMKGVREVRQLDDQLLFWAAEIGGQHKQWQARITRQEPGRLIAWRSQEGAANSGTVTFEPLGANRTAIKLDMEYETEGLKEQIGDLLGIGARRVEGDLKRFKEFLEARGVEIGGWRGAIRSAGPEPGNAAEPDRQLYGASGQAGTNYGGTREGGIEPGTPGGQPR